MAKKHYFITGGAGFIGSHLAERILKEGHRVTIIDDFNSYYDPAIKRQNIAGILDQIELIEGDIRDAILVERSFAKGQFDHVIHIAARAGVRPSIKDPKLYFTTNIDGTFNLLDACRYHGVKRFTFASSSSVYGVNKKVPFAESDALERTISPYAATKLAGEQICSNYANLFGMHCQCLRFFTVYGPRQRPDLAISKFTKHILAGIPIQKYGDGSTARDYTYIDDIINGIIAASNYNEADFEIFNLGGSATTTLSELITMIEEATGKKAIIEQLPDQPGDVPRTYADVSKAHKLLGYAPATPIAEGIRKYVEWFKAQN
ncbi:GDP-mannose 4,6-dehydratase [Coraliomargarita algicola]|uniref:GDP-mannose 4,6-dehydratase n=1 Tax=Coraliomargarita algicola TaxID=3092156 RepID=A0ABZ0RQB6_9BACT|nr:GDP-mannose 4,6-dehydratase [Coraliomargarita sp. J2-16]WPJ97311.1 GDP-mannose 4,6-dehydratase [Coraliomargarita sp. J2-16]